MLNNLPSLAKNIKKHPDELRGSMVASQCKDYFRVLLFVRYVSDKYAGKFLQKELDR